MTVEEGKKTEDKSSAKEDDDDVDFEIIDDTPEEDRNRPRRASDAEPNLPDDDEIGKYSEKVQKRIKDLRYEFHEERRAKEEAQRQLNTAVEYAKRALAERDRIQRTLSEGEKALISTGRSGSQAAIENAKGRLRRAQEEGDPDAIANAQAELSKAVFDQQRWEGYQPRYNAPAQQPQYPQQPQQPRQQQPEKPKPDPKAEEWAKRNPWFNEDRRMTGFAFGVHQDLVTEGVDPRSDEYYTRLDQEMRKAFPDRFEEAADQSRRNAASSSLVVASSSRSGGKPRKIQVTRSEAEIAKKLGVPIDAYAREKMKGMRNE